MSLSLQQSPTVLFHRNYVNLINGTEFGENSVSVSSDGTSSYKADIHLASINISEVLTTHSKEGEVVNYSFDVFQSNSHTSFDWDGKTLKIDSKQGKKSLPFPASQMPKVWFANYIGGVFNSFSSLDWKQDQSQMTFSTFLVDGQGLNPLTVQKISSHSYKVGNEVLMASGYKVSIAGISASLYFGPKGHFVGELVPSQNYEILESGVTGLFDDPIAKYPELSQSKYDVQTIKKLVCVTRDGTKLVASAVLPTKPGKWPIILERTPYGRAASLTDGMFYAPRGYAVIVQDVRGTGDSGGKFDPFINEEKDGYDTVQWAAHLPFSDGKVGMIGGSYLGAVQWQAAVTKPPALKCIVPEVSPPDAFHNFPYEYGVFMLYPSLWWGNIVKGKNADLQLISSTPKDPKGLLELPLTKVPKATLGVEIPFFKDWLSRDGLDQWKGFDFEKDLLKSKIPALQISGWWDGDGIGTDLHWLKMRAAGRKNQWLIEGPWVHAFDRTTIVDDQNYGPGSIIDLDPIDLRFFDHYLKGKHDGWLKQPKVRYFVMGQNQWHIAQDFPDPAAKSSMLYLNKGHNLEAKPGHGSESYRYDPSKDTSLHEVGRNPLITSGALHCNLPGLGKGLYFESKPFAKSQIIEGPYHVNLWVKINRPSADLFVYLVKIWANHKIEVIDVPGKLNLSYAKTLQHPSNVRPGVVYHVSLFPWMSAVEFKKGQKLALIVTSSEFPMMARNLNTGQPILTGTKMEPVKVTLLYGKDNPSSFSFYKMAP